LSPNVNKEWSFTCGDCPYVPYRDQDPDELAHLQQIDADISPWLVGINPWVPLRCRPCDTAKKRNQRMRQRTKRIWRLAEEIVLPTYHYPKLITFALLTPTYFTDEYSTRYSLLRDLSKLMPKARRILMRNGVLGGTFVFECNSRLTPLDEGQPLFSWRHHPHVHMVAIAPFIHHSKLKKFCELLMPIGLGRINYKAPRSYGVTSRYIAKYLSKQNLNVRSFGIVRKYTLPTNECKCVDDDWPYTQQYCDCIYVSRIFADNLA
tara:strand:+ start:167 stop:955 length:789 start_codon:yes stop_codon:yes gene_type:complete